MGLFKNSIKNAVQPAPPSEAAGLFSGYEYGGGGSYNTKANQVVSAETAKTIATAYRCKNIIGDDVAKMPFQMFVRNGRNVEHVAPDALLRKGYLLGSTNRWMTPLFSRRRSWSGCCLQCLYMGASAEIPRVVHPVFECDTGGAE
jgi:phage portal protein BeeE